jgi:hypothetical protein
MVTINPFAMILSLSGILLFAATIYYNLIILRNIWENDNITVQYLFLHPECSRAFKVFIWGLVSFAIGQMFLAYGIWAPSQTAQNIEDIFSILFLFGYYFFFREIALITRPEDK